MPSNPKAKFLEEMRANMPSPGFVQSYLNWMRSENPEGAESLVDDLRATFTSDNGLRVLKMLEKSILFRPIPDGSDDRALREANALRNFVLEIERIISHGR